MNRLFFNFFKFSKYKYKFISMFLLYNIYNKNVKNKFRKINFYEDQVLINARNKFKNEIIKMKSKYGLQMTTYPEIIIELKGNTYVIKFLIDQRKCDMFTLIIEFLEFSRKNKSIKIKNNIESFSQNKIKSFNINFEEENKNMKSTGSLAIIGEFTEKRPSFELIFEKKNELTDSDVNLIINLYENAIKPSLFKDLRISNSNKIYEQNFNNNLEESEDIEKNEIIKELKKLGVSVYLNDSKFNQYDWSNLAGYESQKRDIEDTVMLSLLYPEVFDDITSKTRVRFEKNRPKAILFEGPPGTGKTTSAKIIAKEANVPLLYLSVESIMSKYYGEAEKNLSEVFELADKLGKSIIFIDEIDSLALSREKDIHEASRRILSTLMKKLDSFESNTDLMLICATNRKKDLDKAILSRLDLSILFNLPDILSRKEIFRRYAKQLSNEDLLKLSENSEGLSGRDIYELCKNAERKFISSKVRNLTEQELPDINNYLNSLKRIKDNL